MITNPEEKEIIQRYTNGESRAAIASKMHHKAATILKVLKKTKTPIRKSKGHILVGSHKSCTNCGKNLSLDQFPKSLTNVGVGFRASWCKNCTNQQHRKWVRKNPYRVWAHNVLWCHSNRYGFKVNIDTDFLISLAKQTKECALCGDPMNYAVGDGFSWLSPTLDRINNSKTLNKDNVWIVHHRCNAAKGQQPKKEFIRWVKRIASRFEGDEE